MGFANDRPRPILGTFISAGKIDIETVGLGGKFVFKNFAPVVRSALLKFAGDSRHRVAVGIEDLGNVTVLGESASGVDFAAGVARDFDSVGDQSPAADVVMVVQFGVVATLDREGEALRAAYVHLGAREERALGKLAFHERSELGPELRADLQKLDRRRTCPAVGEIRADAGNETIAVAVFHRLFGARQPRIIDESAGRALDGQNKVEEVAVAVVPISAAFGAVTVLKEAFKEELHAALGAFDKLGAYFGVGNNGKRRANHGGVAYRVPVGAAEKPPVAVELPRIGGILGGLAVDGEDPAVKLGADLSFHIRRQTSFKEDEHSRQRMRPVRSAEIDGDTRAVEVYELRIVRRHRPAALTADGVEIFDDLFEILALAFLGLGGGKALKIFPAQEIRFLVLGTVSVLSEHEIQFVGAVRNRLFKKRVGAFDVRSRVDTIFRPLRSGRKFGCDFSYSRLIRSGKRRYRRNEDCRKYHCRLSFTFI